MTRPLPRDPGQKVYGNGTPWPDVDTEPPPPRVVTHAPTTVTVYESDSHGGVPIGTATRCRVCLLAWPCPVARKETP